MLRDDERCSLHRAFPSISLSNALNGNGLGAMNYLKPRSCASCKQSLYEERVKPLAEKACTIGSTILVWNTESVIRVGWALCDRCTTAWELNNW